MKKHITLSLLAAAVMLAPNVAVFADSLPTSSPQDIQPTKPVVDPAPRAECLAINKNMGIGSRDADTAEKYNTPVKALQTLLQENGFFSLTPTGYFGSVTSSSVKAFQRSNGVPATGYFGPLTRAKIVALYCKLGTVEPSQTSSITVTSPKAGDGFAPGSMARITWTDKNTYIQAQKYDITLAPYINCGIGKPCNMMAIKPYTIATGTMLVTDGFAWKVGTSLESDRQILDAQYIITVCPTGSGGSNCAQSGIFTIANTVSDIKPEPIATSTMSRMSPNSGPIGTKVRLDTTFSNDINHINFGTGYIPKSAITVGNGYVEFNVPNQLAPACYYAEPVHCMIAAVITPPDKYIVSFTLNNGNNSNKFPFIVTAQ